MMVSKGWKDGILASVGVSPMDSESKLLDDDTAYWLERGANEIPGFATRIEHLASSNIYDSDSSQTEAISFAAGESAKGRLQALRLVARQAKFYLQKKEYNR